MKPKNFIERKKAIISFAGFFTASLLLMLLLLTVFWNNHPEPDKAAEFSPEGMRLSQHVTEVDGSLHEQLTHLLRLDQQYAFLLSNPAGKAQQDSVDKLILSTEVAFRKTLDSIDGAGSGSLLGVVSSFRQVLDSRRSAANLRSRLASGGTKTDTNQQSILKWQNDLLEKDIRIADLESQLKAMPKEKKMPGGASGDQESLRSENEALKSAVAEQENKNNNMRDLNLVLKRDNDRLKTLLNGSSPEADMRFEKISNRAATFERRAEELDAALHFAEVDCNLSRADARQIISNSRQRRELLSQALNILNDLSKSDDEFIQKKAKEKLAYLNSIASMIRD